MPQARLHGASSNHKPLLQVPHVSQGHGPPQFHTYDWISFDPLSQNKGGEVAHLRLRSLFSTIDFGQWRMEYIHVSGTKASSFFAFDFVLWLTFSQLNFNQFFSTRL